MGDRRTRNQVGGNTIFGGSRKSQPLMTKAKFSLQAMPSRGGLVGMPRQGGVPPSYGAPEEEELEFERRAPSQSPQSAGRAAAESVSESYDRFQAQNEGVLTEAAKGFGRGMLDSLGRIGEDPRSGYSMKSEGLASPPPQQQASAPVDAQPLRDFVNDPARQRAYAEAARDPQRQRGVKGILPRPVGPGAGAGGRYEELHRNTVARKMAGKQPMQPAVAADIAQRPQQLQDWLSARDTQLAPEREVVGQQAYGGTPSVPQQQGTQYSPTSVDPRDLESSTARQDQQAAAALRKEQAGQLSGTQDLNAKMRALAEQRTESMAQNEKDRLDAYWGDRQAQDAAAAQDALYGQSPEHRRQMKQATELERQQIAAVNGSTGYQVGQEGGDAGLLTEGRQGQAMDEFRQSGAGYMANRDRMAAHARMAAQNQAETYGRNDATLANRQRLAKKYGEKYPDRVKVMGDDAGVDADRIALTGKQADPEVVAAQEERIRSRREARGGVSERQMRDISRRASNPKALQAYALRNGLHDHPMVNRLMDEATGGRKSSQRDTGTAFSGDGVNEAPSRSEMAKASSEAEALAESETNKFLGTTAESDFYDDSTSLAKNIDTMAPEDLQEWAAMYQKKFDSQKGQYHKDTDGSAASEAKTEVRNATRILAEAVNSGDEKRIEEARKAFSKAMSGYSKGMEKKGDPSSFSGPRGSYTNPASAGM